MLKSNNILFLYNQKPIIYDGKELQTADFKESKNSFTAATVPLNYLSIFSYKIANTTDNDAIAMQTEIKMYNEAGLNPDKAYIIDYIKYDLEGEYLIEAFALSRENFDNIFSEYLSKVTAIDMVFPRCLTYQSLYSEKLNKSSNDLILYISETESFATLYQNGKYIGHRVLSSLSEISKSVGVEVVKLKEFLQTKGLLQENYNLDEMHIFDLIQNIFFKDIEKIIYSINQKRSLFGFDGINRIIIDFNEKNILGLEQFFIPYGYDSLEIITLSFKEDKKYGEIFLYMDYIYMLHNISSTDENLYQQLSLSFLERKKPLVEYFVLKYGILFVVALLIPITIYAYSEMVLSQEQKQLKEKQLRLKQEKQKYLKYSSRLKIFQKEYVQLQKREKKTEELLSVYQDTINAIPLIQDTKYKREKFMNDVLGALKKYKLNTEFINQYDATSMDVMLISDKKGRNYIAMFMDELLAKHYRTVSTEKIHLENNIYKSMVRIKL